MNPKHAKRDRFIIEYLKDQNGTQAAMRAGYTQNPKAAEVQASRLLSNAIIRGAIESKLHKIEEDCGISVGYVLTGLKEVAERTMQRVPVMVRDPRDGRKFIQKTDENGEGVWEFDSTGANRSLELLGKYKKMFTDKVEHDVSKSLEQLLTTSRNGA